MINGITLHQQVIPDHLQTRVNTMARMIDWVGQPFGAALGGVVTDALDMRTALLIVAVGVGLSVLLVWFSPLREAVVEQPPVVRARGSEHVYIEQRSYSRNGLLNPSRE